MGYIKSQFLVVLAVMIVHQGSKSNQQRWILLPNASLNRRQAKLLLSLVGLGMTLIGGGFAWAGAWPVLPFAGMELGLLGYGLNWSMRQSAVRELIAIDPVKVKIERIIDGNKICHEFYRAWVQLTWEQSRTLGQPSRLFLGSHGKRIEVGAFLISEEKAVLMKALRQELFLSTS